MAFFIDIFDKPFHAQRIVGHHRYSPVKYMIDRHQRNLGPHKFLDLCRIEINTGGNDSIYSPVAAMFNIVHTSAGVFSYSKCDVIAFFLSFFSKAFQYMIEIIMSQSAKRLVYKQNSQIVTSFCLQRPGRGIRQVAHFRSCLQDQVFCFDSDIRIIVQCFADSSNGNIAFLSDISH